MNSHYRRLLAAAIPAIAGRAYNDAASGADMADLDGQAQRAVSQGVEYVTVLMGANDVCASSEAAMTPIATSSATQFQTAMSTLDRRLPGARIDVVEHPRRLPAAGRSTGTSVHGVARVDARPGSASRCSPTRGRTRQPTSPAVRACGSGTSTTTRSSRRSAPPYVTCRFDGNAVFNTAFARSDVTTRDYFHPSLAGQAKLARRASWAAGYALLARASATSRPPSSS